jgi:hypothetical protein
MLELFLTTVPCRSFTFSVEEHLVSLGIWSITYGVYCTVKFASLWSVIEIFSCNKIFILP